LNADSQRLLKLKAPCFLALSLFLIATNAGALDKQGSAHGGKSEREGRGSADSFGVSGSFLLGAALYNPTYAARPDNTGLALLRYAVHADIDLIGQKLSLPLDVNLFTDRARKGALVFVPTELDVIAGVTSTWPALGGSVEMGLRFEQDRALDQGSYRQEYGDLRVRYLTSATAWVPKFAHALSNAVGGGSLRGWLGQGTFVLNPTYAARPDNSGLALFRYIGHVELSALKEHVGVSVDTTWFTAREKNHFAPSELDLTLDVAAKFSPYEFHLAYERDLPVDRAGLVQQFVFGYASLAFDTRDR
jgi:hypothetical protein